MAMQTGTMNGANNASDIIKAFIEANGWTINSYVTQGAGKRLHAVKNGCYINWRSLVSEGWQGYTTQSNGLFSYISTGYNAGSTYYDQPGRHPFGSEYTAHGFIDLDGAAMTYYAYAFSGADWDTVLIFINTTGNIWQHMGFGTLKKCDTYTGGQYGFGSCYPNVSNPAAAFGLLGQKPNNYFSWLYGHGEVNVTSIGGFTGMAWASGAGTVATPRLADTFWNWQQICKNSPNLWNNVQPLDQYEVFISLLNGTFVQATTPFGKLGKIPELFVLNIKDYAPGSLYTIGADNYRVFPVYQKDLGEAVDFSTHTGTWGIAVKE